MPCCNYSLSFMKNHFKHSLLCSNRTKRLSSLRRIKYARWVRSLLLLLSLSPAFGNYDDVDIPDIVAVAKCALKALLQINLVIFLSKNLFSSPFVVSMPYLPFRMCSISSSLLQELRNSFAFLMSCTVPSSSLTL